MAKRLTKDEKDVLRLFGNTDEGILYFSEERVETLVNKGLVEQNPGIVLNDEFATRLTASGLDQLVLLKPKEEPPEPIEVEVKDGYVGEVEIEEEEEEQAHPTLPWANVAPEPSDLVLRVEVEAEPPIESEVPSHLLKQDFEVIEEEKKQVASDFELEKGIEIGHVARRPRGSYKYPFEKMEVGDSFHVASTEKRPNPARTLASTVSSASKKYDKVFRVRTVGDLDPKGQGARVFRLK